ncbi:hypothetical protein DY000_02021348 [Brassica cretica]|uniref:Peptidase A2 domain-containing protein n=1 Tax=Brassica cretica TaxID=69181 RepID=A0ABQ7E6X9_BRACR|nr:hypothetical protein DY000_02021348 [Brassica cretica]
MKQRITLKKKSDPGKFVVPCLLKGIEFPCALCDTGSSVSILRKVIADHLGLKIDPSEDSFTFVDYSTRNSGGIIRNLEVQIGNAVVPVDFHVMDNKMNMNHSLLIGRAFIATTSNTGVNSRFIAACYCELKVEYETEYEALIDNRSYTSINSAIQPTIGNHSRESIDSSLANEIFSLQVHCYLSFAVNTQPQTSIDYHYGDTISRQGDYSIGSWADNSHHERFAVDTELPEMRSDEYDEDYHIDKTIEYGGLAMDDRGVLHTSIADNKATSIGHNTKPVIDTHHTPDSEVQLKDNTYYGYLTTEEFGIFRDPEGQARAMDGRILNISNEDIAEVIAMSGPINFLDTQNRVEDPPSIDKADASLINGQSEFRLRALHQNRKRKPHWEMRNEYSVISTVPEQATYRKAEVDELVASIYRAMRTTDDSHSKMLDDVYYPFDNSISWLTTSIDEMMQDIAMIQEQHAVGA